MRSRRSVRKHSELPGAGFYKAPQARAARALRWVWVSLLIAACSLPDYRFDEQSDAPTLGSCNDSSTNGEESDIDCGGPVCNQCLPGRRCREPRDCAGGECLAGICSRVCAVGTDDCDKDPSNGCETDTRSDPKHCGLCSRGCISIQGEPFCSDASCGIQCADGYGDCDQNPANGCERDLTKDVKNCGACNHLCQAVSGTPWCRDGVCGISDCPPGFGDCNASLADGCEADLTGDAQNCKDCGTLCLAANGSAACQGSGCKIIGCKPGFDDCNAGTPEGYRDGCETNTHNDSGNCGACGHACSLPNSAAKCEAGSCALSSCTLPWADCDQDGVDCEVNTETNSQHCGGCASNGLDCGLVWGARHALGRCVQEACVFDGCLGGFRDCNGDSALDGCESNVLSDPLHCGACNAACLAPHGTNPCNGGACQPTCGTLYGDCDSNPRNGCEAVLATDAANCGACGRRCEPTQAANACVAGTCIPSCNPGYVDCDGNPNNGCETDARTSKAHCGRCGAACQDNHTSSNVCVMSACVPACVVGYSDCDASRANGCETLATTCAGPVGGCSVPNSVLCDDFEDGVVSDWTPSGGTWTVVTDGTRVYQSPIGGYQSVGQTSWGDQSVEARVKVLAFGGVGSSYRAGILARYADGSNHYALTLDAAGDLRILRGASPPSGATGSCAATPTGLTSGTWFVLKLQVTGASPSVRLRSYLNGALIHDCLTISSPVAGGSVGLLTYGSGVQAAFDDVIVTSP